MWQKCLSFEQILQENCKGVANAKVLIDLFKDDQVGEIPNGIKWFSGKEVSNPFVSKIEELNNRRSEIESRISKFFNESFKEPVSKEQKDQLELVKKLKG